jgi:FAD/FMN-containing dehydrogenase
MDTVTLDARAALRSALRGKLVEPQDPDFDSSRTIWNAMIDRRPALISRCTGAADVIATVRFARDNRLSLAVRGGGHNIGGSALCKDGIVADLSAMRSVQVDPIGRRAWVEGGALLGDVDHEPQAFGLAVPLGINSTTGVGGLTLGGGFGWLSRTLGLAVDQLRAVDLVDANGTLLHVDAEHHADLFWAVRGGGGNFGVVTSFEFALNPVGPLVTAGLMIFPHEQAQQVLQQYARFTAQLRDDLSVWAVLRKAPPLPFLPASVHGTGMVALAVFSPRTPDEVQGEFATLRSFGTLLGEHIGPMPYTAWQKAFDPLLTPGARNYWKSHNFAALGAGAIDAIVDYAGRLPSPDSEIFLGMIGGEANRRAVDATAYPHRNTLYAMNVHTRWTDPADDAACIAWAREFFRATIPFAEGSVYINFLTEDEGERIREAYGPNYERLAALKARYDPLNLFCNNQNIRPAALA